METTSFYGFVENVELVIVELIHESLVLNLFMIPHFFKELKNNKLESLKLIYSFMIETIFMKLYKYKALP